MRKGAPQTRRPARAPLSFEQVLGLRSRRLRDERGLFFAEGIRFLADAVHHRAPLRSLVVAPSLLTNAYGRRMVEAVRRVGVLCLEAPAAAFRTLSLAEEPQGIGLVARQRWTRLAGTRPGAASCWLALDEVRSAGNLGSMIRTAEAVSAAGIIVLPESVDPFDPVAVRATMGAIFAQRLIRATPGQLAAWKRQNGVTLVGAAPSAAVDYRDAAYPRPLAVLMGGERRGLAPEHRALCDLLVRIPMSGRVDSLNVAVATGVVLYEAVKGSGSERSRRRHAV